MSEVLVVLDSFECGWSPVGPPPNGPQCVALVLCLTFAVCAIVFEVIS